MPIFKPRKKKTKAPETTRLLSPSHSIHISFQKHPPVRSRLRKNREDGDHDGVGVAAWRCCLGDIFPSMDVVVLAISDIRVKSVLSTMGII